LKTVASCDTTRFMGTWFVVGVKPTPLETTCSNAVEKYTLLDNEGSKKHDIDIDFQYNPKEDPFDTKNSVKSLPQKGWVQGNNRLQSGDWKVSPFWPIKMTYPIIELDEKDYSYAVIGYPSRAYCWILSRKPNMEETLYKDIEKKLVDNHQYDLEGLRKVPQKWTADERTKRGLTEEELPDSFLTN
jgi:apolipoprotein D and lipocalin family protein